jgi:hypothetical protein
MKKRAFVRYSKQGKIVPGSLILTSGSFPQGPSTWKEVPADLCCETVRLSTQVDDQSINNVSVRFLCDSTIVDTSYSSLNSTNGNSMAAILNEEFGATYGVFTYVTDGTFTLDIKVTKVKELCPNGAISFEIFAD